MPRARANGIELEYDTFGERQDRPLLLIMGLGSQMTLWDESLCCMLAGAGHYVIRYDARDIGLSTRIEAAGAPDFIQLLTLPIEERAAHVGYLLSDMAQDAVGLLDALEIRRAHVVGVSMGGMVAQVLGIEHRSRIASLTSIMSTTGHPDLPHPTPEAVAVLTRGYPPDRDGYVETYVANLRALSGSRFPVDDELARERARQLYDRGHYAAGAARHQAAILASPNRREALRAVRIPALVIHGDEDPLVRVEGGMDTHQCLEGSRLLCIPGMGHMLPRALFPQLTTEITRLTKRAG